MSETVTEAVSLTKQPTKIVELTIAGLQEDLKNGITRKAQAKKYGVPLTAINRAYKNQPLLKGKRVFSPRGSSATQIVFTDAPLNGATPTTETSAVNDVVVNNAPTSNTIGEGTAEASW